MIVRQNETKFGRLAAKQRNDPRNHMTQPIRAATKHSLASEVSVMILLVTNNGRIKCARFELALKIVITIPLRWIKIPSQERPTWAKSQPQRCQKVPNFADVKCRGSRAYSQHISANQALEIKRTTAFPNSAFVGVRDFSVFQSKNDRRKTRF